VVRGGKIEASVGAEQSRALELLRGGEGKLASLRHQGRIRAGGDQRTWALAKWSTAGVEMVGDID
jgi:hypothetical protein